MDTLYTFWDISTHYKTESVNLGAYERSERDSLLPGNVATKFMEVQRSARAYGKGPGSTNEVSGIGGGV